MKATAFHSVSLPEAAEDDGGFIRALLWIVPLGLLGWAAIIGIGWAVLRAVFWWLS